jgi:mannose-6-phosphate isomerase
LSTPEEAVRGGGGPASTAARLPRRVEKPWGYVLIWAETEDYVGRILHVRAGEAQSLHFHEEREETVLLLRGEAILEAGTGVNSLQETPMQEGETVHLSAGLLHRILATTDAELIEVSTPDTDDIVRIRDRYGRVPPLGEEEQ